jgi:hypothetical protein
MRQNLTAKHRVCVIVLCVLLTVRVGRAQDQPSPFTKYYQPVNIAVEPNAPGYDLPLDLSLLTNYEEVTDVLGLPHIGEHIARNGFAVVEHDFGYTDPNRDDMVKPYTYLKKRGVPLFVTADTLLHLYHIQFGETLKEIEEQSFVADIIALTEALLAHTQRTLQVSRFSDPDWAEAWRRNLAYLSVAHKLLIPEAEIDGAVAEEVAAELALIEAHGGFEYSPLFVYREDYSQYVPRGHYTRSEELKRYFRALMWYGRMAFLLKGAEPWGPDAEALISVRDARIQTLQALVLSEALRDVQVDQRTALAIWDRLYAVTAFYVGLADDLTPYDYLWALDQVRETDSSDPETYVFAVQGELATLPSPKIFGGAGDVGVQPPFTPDELDQVLEKSKGMRLMGQRFIPDSYMFQHFVFPEVLDYTGSRSVLPFTSGNTGNRRLARCIPRGLDVMAILDSKEALHILIEEGDTDYLEFWKRFGELKSEFERLGPQDWNRNLYWSWLHALNALAEDVPEGYPHVMRTRSWQRHRLQSALASWTQLRHDTILYAKQSYTPVERGRLPMPVSAGYVEPEVRFLGRLIALTRMTRDGLGEMSVLSEAARIRLDALEALLDRTLQMAVRELRNEALTVQDDQYIARLAEILEGIVADVDDAGIKTTLVADVHTHTAEDQVLEEAVGKVDLIIVACPQPDGTAFLAAGPVFSYYEFKHPMDQRLTDDVWRDMLRKGQTPARPLWYHGLMP